MNYRRELTKKRHREQGGKCCYCGVTTEMCPEGVPSFFPTMATLDHIVPRRGRWVTQLEKQSNLILACAKCNNEKGNKPVEEFLQDKPDSDYAKVILNAAIYDSYQERDIFFTKVEWM